MPSTSSNLQVLLYKSNNLITIWNGKGTPHSNWQKLQLSIHSKQPYKVSYVLCLSLNILYLLKCAKGIRHKLNKLMDDKSQHYLIEHACTWTFLSLICVNWTRTENEERNEREREGGGGVCVVFLSLLRTMTLSSLFSIDRRAIYWLVWFGVWCLTTLSTIVQLYRGGKFGGKFNGGGNRSTRRKPPTSHKSFPNFIT
jgi:hypothetical protein